MNYVVLQGLPNRTEMQLPAVTSSFLQALLDFLPHPSHLLQKQSMPKFLSQDLLIKNNKLIKYQPHVLGQVD
jgi:hypothetical protein